MKDVLKYKDFHATIHFSEPDNTFYGKIQGIDDSITFEGNSVAQLRKALKEAVEDYLSICRKMDKDPHKSYKGSFNVRINPDLHKQAVIQVYAFGSIIESMGRRGYCEICRKAKNYINRSWA